MFSFILGYKFFNSLTILFNFNISGVKLFPVGLVLTYNHGVLLNKYSELIVEQVKEIKLRGLF